MHKINRYIGKVVVSAIAMVLLVVLPLDFIGRMIDDMDKLRADYNVYELFIYVLWGLPQSLYDFMPFAVLIGCLIGLGVLANASELVVIRAAGVSVARIVWMVLKPVLVFVFLGILLGEYIIPYADQISESRRALAMGKKQTSQSGEGIWHRENNDFMHFNVVLPNGKIYGVTRYQFDNEYHLIEASFAEQANFSNGRWQEESVTVTHFTPEKTTSDTITIRDWETALSPNVLNILALPPETLSIASLYTYSNYLDEKNLHKRKYTLVFWQKVLQPLATVSLVLIAISFVFGPLREVSMGQKIFTGVVFGIVFRLIQNLLGPSSIVFNFSPLLAVLAPIVLCFFLGVYLLRRAG